MIGHYFRRRNGQALLVVMLALPLFFSVCALVVDGTNLMVNKRKMQNAADAISLAAAQSLVPADGSPTQGQCRNDYPASPQQPCQDVLESYRVENGVGAPLHQCSDGDPANPSDTNCYAAPYVDKSGAPHVGLIEVRLKSPISGFFASVVGIKKFFDVAARAVASTTPQILITPGTVSTSIDTGSAVTNITPESTSTSYETVTTPSAGGSPAVYVGKPNCGNGPASFEMSGGPVLFTGGIISNGGWDSPATAFNPGTGASSYGGPNSCTPARTVTDPDIVLTSNATAGVPWPSAWDPAVVTPASIPCDFYAPGTGTGKWTFPTAQPVPGVYCARRPDGTSASEIELPSGLVCTPNCTFTLVAPKITVQGTNKTYIAYYNHLLWYATGGNSLASGEEDQITVANQGNSFQGVIYAPRGYFRLSNGGNNGGSSASIVAWGVNLSGGNGLQFTGAYAPIDGAETVTTNPTGTTTYPGSTVVIVTPGSTSTTTTPAQTNTIGTTIGLGE